MDWYWYAGFIAFVVAMLLLDLKIFHGEARRVTVREAAAWVSVWVGLAMAFGLAQVLWRGPAKGAEYFAGYLIEYSLSVDNMFVFIVIFSYFQVRPEYQHQVLFYGILGAIVFRGIFIALGTVLIHRFEWVLYVFGVLLIVTAVRIARGSDEVHPEQNPVLRFFQRRFRTTTRYDGHRLFTMENGRRVATPLFVVLLVIETTDIVFAVDSIPAIFGITRDPFIVLTSNVFAILGLRAVYFLLAGGMARFHYLKYGLSVILGFVGVKMLLPVAGALLGAELEVPIWVSLGIIVGVLALTAALSLKFPPGRREVRAFEPGDATLPEARADPSGAGGADGRGPTAAGRDVGTAVPPGDRPAPARDEEPEGRMR